MTRVGNPVAKMYTYVVIADILASKKQVAQIKQQINKLVVQTIGKQNYTIGTRLHHILFN
jgi:hypothetical protein